MIFGNLKQMTITKTSFNSDFDVNEATLKISNFCSIKDEEIYLLYKTFNQFGFVLVDCTSAQDFLDELEALKRYFGRVIRHKRSDDNGVSAIKVTPGLPDYFGTTNEDTGLHTDGACSKTPPKIVIFQCQIPSQQGGETQLLSCKLLYKQIIHLNSELVAKLFDPNTFTIIRDEEVKTNCVFAYGENNKIFTIFRANGNAKVSVADESKEAFLLARKITKDKRNILQFKLKKNQILIIDNTSVMHGRLSFPINSKRKLNRLFLDGNISPKRLNFGFEA